MSLNRTLSPYLRLMRLHQPAGIGLLLWPCWWSATMASGGRTPISILALFAIGAVLMRSAGCIINDLADREFDAKVERTRNRPLASGELQPMQACALLAVLLLAALGVAYELGPNALRWSVLSLPLVVAYPWMKRISWWPQLFLGLTFNWGALVGWASIGGNPGWPAVLLYAGGVFWTLGYDTIYAHQDKKDDARIGIKSSALRLGASTKTVVGYFYAAAIACFFAAGVLLFKVGMPYYAFVVLGSAQLACQLKKVDLDDPASCRRAFVSNATQFGWCMFAACAFG